MEIYLYGLYFNKMKELMRSSDLVQISFLQSSLMENGIDTVILDEHTSAFYVGALIPRRVMVLNEDYDAALRIYNDLKSEHPEFD